MNQRDTLPDAVSAVEAKRQALKEQKAASKRFRRAMGKLMKQHLLEGIDSTLFMDKLKK